MVKTTCQACGQYKRGIEPESGKCRKCRGPGSLPLYIPANERLRLQQNIDMDELAEKVAELLDDEVRTVVVKISDLPPIEVANVHEKFEVLLTVLANEQNAMLVGPAGSFKTTAAKKAADAMHVPFDYIALGPTTTESKIFGYMDANGNYSPTGFRKVYENGGVFLFDEIDSANPAVLISINAAIDNGLASFPDGLVERHPKAVFVAAANTYGRGADRQYVGRNQLDAATLDRFAVIDWDYDERLEMQMARNKEWCKRVQRVRAAVMKSGLRHVVSPRATFRGEVLLAAGLPQNDVETMLVWKGLDKASKDKIVGMV